MNANDLTPADLARATGDYAAAGLPMSAERFRELRARTGWSLAELAAALGMTGRHAAKHLRDMEDGRRDIPGPTGRALAALADGWRPGAWPDAEEIDFAIEDAVRLAEHPNCRPFKVDTFEGGYNGIGRALVECAALLRRLTGRG